MRLLKEFWDGFNEDWVGVFRFFGNALKFLVVFFCLILMFWGIAGGLIFLLGGLAQLPELIHDSI